MDLGGGLAFDLGLKQSGEGRGQSHVDAFMHFAVFFQVKS